MGVAGDRGTEPARDDLVSEQDATTLRAAVLTAMYERRRRARYQAEIRARRIIAAELARSQPEPLEDDVLRALAYS